MSQRSQLCNVMQLTVDMLDTVYKELIHDTCWITVFKRMEGEGWSCEGWRIKGHNTNCVAKHTNVEWQKYIFCELGNSTLTADAFKDVLFCFNTCWTIGKRSSKTVNKWIKSPHNKLQLLLTTIHSITILCLNILGRTPICFILEDIFLLLAGFRWCRHHTARF